MQRSTQIDERIATLGRAGIKRRKRYRRLPKVQGNPGIGAWERTRSPYLIESQIEDYGRFARGLRYAPRWARITGRTFVIAVFLLPIAISAIASSGSCSG